MSVPFTMSFTMERGRYEALRQRLVELEVRIFEGDSGKIEFKGCDIWCDYNGTELELTITDIPMFASALTVRDKLQEFINQI